eukprot:TRINITY_DN4030_c0_g1_i1.p1 TRINITY_DN4030_c0_g1~~TRINITY_DN4030_c0_g1_i1.p1  ORF type:complete len:449 (-),score=81.72 TRINITY_DN4030_c0_g1_i1:44-1390(-)
MKRRREEVNAVCGGDADDENGRVEQRLAQVLRENDQLKRAQAQLQQQLDLAKANNEELLQLAEKQQEHAQALEARTAHLVDVEQELSRVQVQLVQLTNATQVSQDVRSAVANVQADQKRNQAFTQDYERLTRENSVLRERAENTFILNEQLAQLHSKSLRAEQELRRYAALEVQYNDTMVLHRKWEGYFGELRSYGSADQILALIASLQSDKELLTEKLGKAQLNVRHGPEDTQKIQELTVQAEKLNKDNAQMAAQLAHYEQRFIRGDYDPSITKVLHLIDNPTSQALRPQPGSTEEMDRLRRELQYLKTQIAQGAVPDAGPHSLQQENENLKRSLASKAKEHSRLIEICRQKITEFRETVYMLFGYKIDFSEDHKDKKYILTCKYSQQDSDKLLFQKTRKHGLALLANEYSESLAADIDTYLGTCRSIPAFLANNTLTLFQAQTFAA